MITVKETTINRETVKKALDCLKDNGIERSECPVVLQALGYILMDTELEPLFVDTDYEAAETNRFCSISTAHITKETDALLKAKEGVKNDLPIYFPKRINGTLYGYIFVVAGWDEYDERHSSCPDDLKACLQYAQSLDCAMLVLDGDCEIVDGLPVYEW